MNFKNFAIKTEMKNTSLIVNDLESIQEIDHVG